MDVGDDDERRRESGASPPSAAARVMLAMLVDAASTVEELIGVAAPLTGQAVRSALIMPYLLSPRVALRLQGRGAFETHASSDAIVGRRLHRPP